MTNKNIFINKNLIISDNFYKTAKLIKSPFNDNFAIWIPNARTHKSKYNNYISIYLESEKKYKLFKYKNYEILEIKEIKGDKLITGYQNLKFSNSFKFLHQKSKNNDLVPKNKEFITQNYQFVPKNNDFVPKNENSTASEMKKILKEIDNL